MIRSRILSVVVMTMLILSGSPLNADDPIKSWVDRALGNRPKSAMQADHGVDDSETIYKDDYRAKNAPIPHILGKFASSLAEAGLITEREFNQVLIELRRYHTDEEIRVALSEAQQSIHKMTQGDFWDKVTSDCPGVCGDLVKILLFIQWQKLKPVPKWILLFEIGSEAPSYMYNDDLYKIKSRLESSSSGAYLLLMGRGSRSTGSRKTNRILSKKRNAAVMQKLIEIGVPQHRLKRADFGYEPPYLTGKMINEYRLWDSAINMGITPNNFASGDWNQSVLIALVK